MLRKVSKLILVAGLGLALASTSLMADAAKGQKIYIKFLKKPCGTDGAGMAKKHTQAEWKAMFDAATLNDDLGKMCPGMAPLKDKQLQDVYDFLFNYASDSGNVPAC